MSSLLNLKLFTFLIISVAVILAVTSVWNDSIIVDEVPHIGAGYSYLVKKDMRLNPEHPPLAKDLAAIPLLFSNLNQQVFTERFWLNDVNGQWEFGRKLIFNSSNDAQKISRVVKLPMLLFFVLAAILIFKWSRRLYGNTGALIALILFSFSPTIVAHSRFVTTDIAALFGVLLATYFSINYFKDQSRRNLVFAGLAIGVALLAKFSTFLILPYLVLLSFCYAPSEGRSPKKRLFFAFRFSLFAFLIAFVLVVWPVYFFHTYGYPPSRQHNDTQFILSSFGNRPLADVVVWMSDKPVIRALGQYFFGFLMVTQRATGGNTTYFLGEVSAEGWKHYFPIVYFFKEPLAWWALVVISISTLAASARNLKFKARGIIQWLTNHFEEFAMLLWLAIYWASTIKSNLNIGVRHLLPTFPFAIILVSGQISKITRDLKLKAQNYSSKLKKIFLFFHFSLFALLGWYIIENLRVYPYYLTYFNQIAGGPSGGYRYVVDSNLDWGQDLKRLADWVNANNVQKIELDYFGWADPSYYLGERYVWLTSTKYRDAQDFATRNQTGGWLAVSATFLQGSEGTPDNYNQINYKNWLQSLKPEIVIGNSIFVYRIFPNLP